jgi:GDPmannose 4,6-dehydratase
MTVEPKIALVTGVLGQTGSYMAEFLLNKNYVVHGLHRRISSGENFSNVESFRNNSNFHLIEGDITDSVFITKLIADLKPHTLFGLAAQSNVGHSFRAPVNTFEVDATAVLLQLEAIRLHSPKTRMYNAATSELFGAQKCPVTGYDENTPFYPRSPYAVAKAAAFYATRNYREAYGIFACSGILHNHSSIRRGLDFATRKITRGVAAIKCGLAENLKMGDLSAFRDESSAKDMVEAIHLIMEQDTPDDFVVSSGSGATIKEMLEYVCGLAGVNFSDIYVQDPRFMRPSDVPYLLGNSSKVRATTGWAPKYDWKMLLKEMYEHDLADLRAHPEHFELDK